MNYLRIGVAILGMLLAIFSWGQYRQIGLQKELIKKQESAIKTAIDKLNQVQLIVEKNDVLMSAMLGVQVEVNSRLSTRQQEIRRLQNDVAEIRQWADQQLPDDIVRMRQRPAATGARAYGQSVPAGSALRAAGGEPPHERRPEPDPGTN
nr:hypothetical protein [Paracandidimonas soli]